MNLTNPNNATFNTTADSNDVADCSSDAIDQHSVNIDRGLDESEG